ncbi:MAG: carboxymuconolactone decarboxylase family protein [Pseudomonadota bacterium]
MPNIQPIDTQNPGDAAEAVAAVKQAMGTIPNIFATMAHSPAVLEGFLAFNGSLAGGTLSPAVREQIALTIAGANTCDYCASAHTLLAKGAGLDEAEAARNLRGEASDARVQAILGFVQNAVANRGKVASDDVSALRASGVSDAEIVEIVAHIGVNIFTNYFNHIAATDVDFPLVSSVVNGQAA